MRKLMILPVVCFFFLIAGNGAALGEYLTKYLSIPGNAFLPASGRYFFERYSSDIAPKGDSSNAWFAPLILPDGARIGSWGLSAMICGSFTDATSVDIGIWERDIGELGTLTELVHLNIDDPAYNCTLVSSSPTSGMDTTKGIALSPIIPPEIFKTIDNRTKTYFISVDGLTGAEFSLLGTLTLRVVRIEYSVIDPENNT